MSKARTKDELIILRLYEVTQEAGDRDIPLNRYTIGKSVGLAAHAVDTICTSLAQCNFIKKIDKIDIKLTEHGERLALTLLQE